jgi:hypothetical protein
VYAGMCVSWCFFSHLILFYNSGNNAQGGVDSLSPPIRLATLAMCPTIP